MLDKAGRGMRLLCNGVHTVRLRHAQSHSRVVECCRESALLGQEKIMRFVESCIANAAVLCFQQNIKSSCSQKIIAKVVNRNEASRTILFVTLQMTVREWNKLVLLTAENENVALCNAIASLDP